MTRRTKKYVAALRLCAELSRSKRVPPAALRALTAAKAGADELYAALARHGYAWDAAAGWYTVTEPSTGRVGVRLEGSFVDVSTFATRLGLQVAPRPGRGGVWLVYGDLPSGATGPRAKGGRA